MDYLEKYVDYLAFQRRASPETIRKVKVEVGQWIRFVGDPTTATRDQARAFLALLEKTRNGESVRVAWSRVRAFHRFLVEEGYPAADAEKVSIKQSSKRLPRVARPEAIAAMLAAPKVRTHTGRRDRAVMEVLLATGMRASELASLKLADVDLERDEVRVVGKGDRERIVPLIGDAKQWLRTWIERDRPFFARHTGNQEHVFLTVGGNPLTYPYVYAMIKRYAKRAGLTGDMYPHLFRHTIASRLINNKMDVRMVQEFLGHANISTTQVYTHVARDAMKAAYASAVGST